jgi:putative addiction module killer protein
MQYSIKETEQFSKWLKKLKDIKAKVAILRRIDRMSVGNFGDHKGLGENLSELRITTGAGYRIYYTIKDGEIVILLVGGNKSTQTNDIKKAKELLKELK